MSAPSLRPPEPPPRGWWAARLDLRPLWALLRRKRVPVHRHAWVYLLGGAALFAFLLQAASGGLLMLYYQPTEEGAHASVERIVTSVPYGWLVRSLHVWGAHLFIAVVLLHLATTLVTQAYRRPRELTWVSGALLLFTVLGFGFSGYLLPWTQVSYFATLVGTQIPGSVPGVGELAVHVLRGGAQVDGGTLTRFYALHVFFLPVGLALLLLVHLALVQAQDLSLPLGLRAATVRDESPLLTEFVLLDAGLWCLMAGLVVSLAVLLPAGVAAGAQPLQPAPEGIAPEWYFLFAYQLLKLVPEWAGVLCLLLGAALLFAVPLLDRAAASGRRGAVMPLVLGTGAVCLALEAWAVLSRPEVATPTCSAATYSRAHGLVTLALVWMAIGWLVYYLRQLRRLNARVRRLYEGR